MGLIKFAKVTDAKAYAVIKIAMEAVSAAMEHASVNAVLSIVRLIIDVKMVIAYRIINAVIKIAMEVVSAAMEHASVNAVLPIVPLILDVKTVIVFRFHNVIVIEIVEAEKDALITVALINFYVDFVNQLRKM